MTPCDTDLLFPRSLGHLLSHPIMVQQHWEQNGAWRTEMNLDVAILSGISFNRLHFMVMPPAPCRSMFTYPRSFTRPRLHRQTNTHTHTRPLSSRRPVSPSLSITPTLACRFITCLSVSTCVSSPMTCWIHLNDAPFASTLQNRQGSCWQHRNCTDWIRCCSDSPPALFLSGQALERSGA